MHIANSYFVKYTKKIPCSKIAVLLYLRYKQTTRELKMKFIEVLKELAGTYNYDKRILMKFEYMNQVYTLKQIIEELEAGGRFSRFDDFIHEGETIKRRYTHNEFGIWSITQDFHLSKYPIFKHID